MPTKTAKKTARKAAKEGKKPTTQAGAFIREETRKMKQGSGNVRSRKQAVAIGLSEARRAGVKLGSPPAKGSGEIPKNAARDSLIGSGREKVSKTRSAGAKKAARTRERRYRRAA